MSTRHFLPYSNIYVNKTPLLFAIFRAFFFRLVFSAVKPRSQGRLGGLFGPNSGVSSWMRVRVLVWCRTFSVCYSGFGFYCDQRSVILCTMYILHLGPLR